MQSRLMVGSPIDLPERQSVGRYHIFSKFAAGGMGAVYFGKLTGAAGFARTVAIKRLHPHLANVPEFVTMLSDEARVAAAIRHPNVVSTLDVVHQDGELLLVMEYIEGATLNRLLSKIRHPTPVGAPSLPLIVRVMSDVLFGLDAAHCAKSGAGQPLHIVHRDVSPQNIIVGIDGITRVLDFGIAKAERRLNTTAPGRLKGKFAYMSPEQLRGQTVDARSDVFAVGVVLWECLTLRRLFVSETPSTTMARVLRSEIVKPSSIDRSLPPELDQLVLKALARRPEDRFSSARDFAQALISLTSPARRGVVGQWVMAMAERSLAAHARQLRQMEESFVTHAACAVLLSAEATGVAPDIGQPLPPAARTETGAAAETVTSVAPASLGWSEAPTPLPARTELPVRAPKGRPGVRGGHTRRLIVGFIAAVFSLIAAPAASKKCREFMRSSAVPGRNVAASARTAHAVAPNVSSLEGTADETRRAGSERPRTSLPATIDGERAPTKVDPSPRTGGSAQGSHFGKALRVVGQPSNGLRNGAPLRSVTPLAKASSVSCDPPYVIDELGIRHIRDECL